MEPSADRSDLALSIRPEPREVRRSSEWLADRCGRWKVPGEALARLDLCLNETLANLLEHGTGGSSGSPINLLLDLHGNGERGEATLTVVDGGAPFDPLAFQPRSLPASVADAVPGGLGLIMVRNACDALSYNSGDRRNELQMTVRWPKGN